MRSLWTDIVQPAVMPLVVMQQKGIRIDVNAQEKEIAASQEERSALETQCVARAADGIRATMPPLPETDPCSDHPEFQGETPRRKCPRCRDIWELHRDYRNSKAVKKAKRLAKFNVASPDHLGWLLYEHYKLKPLEYTDTGKPRTSLKVLEEYLTRKATPDNVVPTLRDLIKIAHLDTLVSVFLSPPIGPDGRVHPPLTLEGTAIGRVRSGMSRFDPDKPSDALAFNIQNIPERARRIYIADPGTLMIEVDAAKIEWILLMVYARCARADAAYRLPDFDVHENNAKLITQGLDIEWAELTLPERKEWRRGAKRLTHGWDYGMTAEKSSKLYRIPLAQARKIREAYFKGWPEILQYQEDTEQAALKDLKLRNCFGRVRRFLDITAKSIGGRKVLRLGELNEALAFLPASTNADIWKIRLRELYDEGFEQVTGTHDSHLMLVDEDRADIEAARAIDICQRPLEELAGYVGSQWWKPMYDAKVGRNWGNYSKDNPEGLKEVA